MPDDDDFKISMDDIKDMVSELFGEKVRKVDAGEARKILKEEMLTFFETGLDSVSESQLSPDEEKLLTQYEAGQVTAAEKPSGTVKEKPKTAPGPDRFGLPPIEGEPVLRPKAPADMDALRKQIEEETREKLKKEFDEEKSKKRADTLRKIDDIKKQSVEYQATLAKQKKDTAAAGGAPVTSHTDKVSLLTMFDQTQKVLAILLSKLIKRKPVDTMFLKTLEKAMEKFPEVLRKADLNLGNKVREDGSLEIARVAANMNAIYLPEEKRTEKFLSALREIFEERLIAIEMATSIEVKDEIMSNLMIQIDKIFDKKNYAPELKDMFIEYVIPSTTMKPGE